MAEITVSNNYEDFRIELKENEGHFSISIENYSGKSKNVIIRSAFVLLLTVNQSGLPK